MNYSGNPKVGFCTILSGYRIANMDHISPARSLQLIMCYVGSYCYNKMAPSLTKKYA